MLYLEVSGNGPTRRCEQVIMWFLGKYLPRHHIDIRVVHRGLKREGLYGCIHIDDCDYRPRSFTIEIHNKLDKENYLKTLLHELTHLKQYVKGELKTKKSLRYWKGELIEDFDYDEDPSEIEAFSMEQILYDELILDKSLKFK